MNSQYFCAHHASKIAQSETEAFRNWSQMMHRGTKAYVECRLDAAEIYLGSALDVVLLRCNCSHNELFSESHLIKPAEFLLEIFLMIDAFDKAEQVLRHICEHCHKRASIYGSVSEQFLFDQFERVEKAEKDFFGVWDNKNCAPLLAFKAQRPRKYH
jgi:hypothetical protein